LAPAGAVGREYEAARVPFPRTTQIELLAFTKQRRKLLSGLSLSTRGFAIPGATASASAARLRQMCVALTHQNNSCTCQIKSCNTGIRRARSIISEHDVNALSFEFDRSNMFEPLLQADPSLREKWEIFQEQYRSDGELPLYLALSELARHLIHDLETGNTHRFDAVFDVVERWHIHGDPNVKEAATVGLLEDLQNGHLLCKTSSEDFLPWLRPETLGWWTKVHEFWAIGKQII
jgi:hypothetical protein